MKVNNTLCYWEGMGKGTGMGKPSKISYWFLGISRNGHIFTLTRGTRTIFSSSCVWVPRPEREWKEWLTSRHRPLPSCYNVFRLSGSRVYAPRIIPGGQLFSFQTHYRETYRGAGQQLAVIELTL